jgi:hypothetical protein
LVACREMISGMAAGVCAQLAMEQSLQLFLVKVHRDPHSIL